MAPLPMTIRCRLIGRAKWLSRLVRQEGLRAGRPCIARAVHNPGQWGCGRGVVEWAPSNQLFGSLPSALASADAARSNAISSQTPRRIFRSAGRQSRAQSAAAAWRANPQSQRYGDQAWTHANPRLIGPMGAPVRGTRLADRRRLAGPLREGRCGPVRHGDRRDCRVRPELHESRPIARPD